MLATHRDVFSKVPSQVCGVDIFDSYALPEYHTSKITRCVHSSLAVCRRQYSRAMSISKAFANIFVLRRVEWLYRTCTKISIKVRRNTIVEPGFRRLEHDKTGRPEGEKERWTPSLAGSVNVGMECCIAFPRDHVIT